MEQEEVMEQEDQAMYDARTMRKAVYMLTAVVIAISAGWTISSMFQRWLAVTCG